MANHPNRSKVVSHSTNGWGRVKYVVVDASADHKKFGLGDVCFEIRHADDGSLSCWSATSRDEAMEHVYGTLNGVVVEPAI